MKIKIEENPYSTLYFDITYRCNLNCKICYNHKLMKDNNHDMHPSYFREVLSRLPKRKYLLRLLGGEPTLHPKLNEFIEIANDFGHTITIGTNGNLFANDKFMEKVKSWKNPELARKNKIYNGSDYPFTVFFDISGGTKHARFYKKLNNKKQFELRIKGVENCLDSKIVCGVTGIIIRDFNEEIIPDLLEYVSKRDFLMGLHFRTMGKSGRWFNRKPYSLEELKELVNTYLKQDIDEYPKLHGYDPPLGSKCRNCCNRILVPEIKSGLSLIEFGTERTSKCWQRGYVNDDFTVSSFFGRIREKG